MIKLTDLSGNSVYLDEKRLCSVSRTYACATFKTPDATRVIVLGDNGCFLVAETPDQVMSAKPIKPIKPAEPEKGETSV